MENKIKLIKNRNELNICDILHVDRLLWGTKSIAPTYARLGFVPDEGFYLNMQCNESNPLRRFHQNDEPVYKDSAMEAFFQFAPNGVRSEIYLNFEMNANGALLARYGTGREGRISLSSQQFEACGCRAVVEENFWRIELCIPLTVLYHVYGAFELKRGSRFYCNFYKISETPEIEHYASHAPIDIERPDFHRPEYFAAAKIV